MTPEKNDATVLLRLPSELKHALTREAFINGRKITAEINMRLVASLAGTSNQQLRRQLPGTERPARNGTNCDKELQELLHELTQEQKRALITLLKRR